MRLYWQSVLLSKALALLVTLSFGSAAIAHEMTPTYPVFKGSYMAGVSVTTLSLFNKRKDVAYYKIGVFTSDWEPVRFVSKYNVIPMDYLDTVDFDVYVNNSTLHTVEYICSVSKLRVGTTVSSKICSRIK
mgnify:FL=1